MHWQEAQTLWPMAVEAGRRSPHTDGYRGDLAVFNRWLHWRHGGVPVPGQELSLTGRVDEQVVLRVLSKAQNAALGGERYGDSAVGRGNLPTGEEEGWGQQGFLVHSVVCNLVDALLVNV